MSLTKAERAAIAREDYAWPDAPGGPTYPITAQARLDGYPPRAASQSRERDPVDAAARRIGRAPASVQPRSTARATAIARRTGDELPDAGKSARA